MIAGADVAEMLERRIEEIGGLIETTARSMRDADLTLATGAAALEQEPGLRMPQVLAAIDALHRSADEVRQRAELAAARIEALSSEVCALRQAAGAVRNVCERDPVTGLPGRTAFERALAASVREAAAAGSDLALLLCNLDYFRDLEAAHGREVADGVLRTVGMLLRSHAPADRFVARLEADTFGIILRARQATALDFAERFRQVVTAREIALGSGNQPVGRLTTSVGVAMLLPGEDCAGLLDRSAQALTTAKHEGRNRVVEMTPAGPVWKAERRT
jgi:diguanylate cyclase (GGDEF)-like protein